MRHAIQEHLCTKDCYGLECSGINAICFPAGMPLVARVVSKFRGVTWDDDSSKWLSTAYEGSNQVNLGLFDNQEDAAR